MCCCFILTSNQAKMLSKMLLPSLLLLATAVSSAKTDESKAKKPNVLFILTDDQDWHMESIVSSCPPS